MDTFRLAYLKRMLAAGLAGAPFVGFMATIWRDWPWWLHSIGALLIWWAATYLVLRFWPLPDRPTS